MVVAGPRQGVAAKMELPGGGGCRRGAALPVVWVVRSFSSTCGQRQDVRAGQGGPARGLWEGRPRPPSRADS